MTPPDPDVLPPRVARDPFTGPTFTIETVCKRAGVPYRYSGGLLPFAATTHGGGHQRAVNADGRRVLVVDLDLLLPEETEPERWLRVLEVLAHSFHEYAARESARGLFGLPGTTERGGGRHPNGAATGTA